MPRMLTLSPCWRYVSASQARVLRQGGHHSAQNSTTLKFWNGTYTTQDPTDKTKDKSEFYIYQAIGRFEAAGQANGACRRHLAMGPEQEIRLGPDSLAQNAGELL